MSRQVRFGVQLTGDHRGAVRSMQVTNQEARRLQGQVDRTTRSARDARTRFQGWAQSLNTVRGAIGPLVGTVGASMLLRMSQQAIASTAAIQEQADTAGVAVEQFQELTKGFKDLGNIQESVTAGALRRFNRRFGLARQGMGAAHDTLRRMNISLEQDTPEALEQVITRLAGMEDGADRAAAASQVFGEDAGPRLAGALGQGEEALQRVITQLNRSGRIMSEEATQAAVELDTRWQKLTDTIGTNARRAILDTTDALVSLHDLIRDELRADFEALGILGVDSVERAARAAEENKRHLDEIFGGQGTELEPITVAAARPSPFDVGAQEARTKRFQEELRTLEDYGRKWEEITPRIVSADEAAERFLATLDPFERGTLRAFQDQITTLDDYAETWAGITPKVRETREEVDGLDGDTGRLNDTAQDLGFTFQSAFEDAIIEGRELRDVMQGILEDIARIAVRSAVTRPAGEALASAFSGAFGGERAEGGPVRQGTSYLVGEKGPEIFTPEVSGNITPNQNIRNGGTVGGTTTVNNNINISADGADPEQLARLTESVRALDRNFERRAVGSMQDARSRGRIR